MKTLLEQKLDCLHKCVTSRDNWHHLIPPMNCRERRKYQRAFKRYQEKKRQLDALNSSML